MNKFGIVSLYKGQNFGNKLQNYATEQICMEYGFEPSTFKYEFVNASVLNEKSLIGKLAPSYISAFVKSFLNGRCNIKNTDTNVIKQVTFWYKNRQQLAKTFKQRENKYNAFDYKNLHFSNTIIKYNEENAKWTNNYSMFLAGSDQVWNPYYLFVGSNNFLQFCPKEKRASIAPSFGVSEIPAERQDDYKKWINGFSFLSVREDAGKKIISDLTGKDSTVISDPTMIVDKKVWDKLANKPSFDLPNKYLLTYFLGNRTKKYQSLINKIAKQNNLKVVNLLDIMQSQYLTCDPAEFVYCIKNAEFVCTDSFHATVFSILYKKTFVTFDRVEGKRSMGSRINTLLSAFDLSNRKFENIHNKDDYNNIDFSNSDDCLVKLQKVAKEYLQKVFDAANAMPIKENDAFDVYNTELCTGCGACVAACPTKALTFEKRDNFDYPVLNNDLCINCNKCKNVCPVFNAKEIETPKTAYAMRIKNEDVLKNSSSGGVVGAISSHCIENDGIVFGAAFNEKFEVEYIEVDKVDDLEKIRKAKYVQSSIIDCFDKISTQLKNDKSVLFIGTPCQVSAVKSYCKDNDKLTTVAIVCHGVPSKYSWQEHISSLEKEHNSKINFVDFRDKSNGWKNYLMTFGFSNGETVSVNPSADKYMSDFYHNKSLRSSCSNCNFKAGNSGADITVGDFWGIDTLSPRIDDNTGISVVTVHSEKGKELINKSNIETMQEFDVYSAMGQNPSYFYSSINFVK